MSLLAARTPDLDWSKEFDRHWHGGNPAVTHIFNALSFLFPQGEQFFMDVVKEACGHVDLSSNPVLAQETRDFIKQEAIHRRQHAQYNAVLNRQGFDNVAHDFVQRLEDRAHRYFSPLTKLAFVCAYEHYTAILGGYILENPEILQPASRDMALVWGWHAAEETEHKAVCFDLYKAARGGWLRRVAAFLMVTMNFNLMFQRVYLSLLYRDGRLHPARLPGTAIQTLTFFFGAKGIGWKLLTGSLHYLRPGFHPWQRDNRAELQAWLAANRNKLRIIGQ